MFDKQGIYSLLKKEAVPHEITEHASVDTMEAFEAVALPYPDAYAKNVFVRDDKKRNYYLITVKGDKRVDIKGFQKKYQTRHLSFASAEDLREILGLLPGSVSPLGLLNDEALKVQFYLDEAFLEEPGMIGVHPNENTATVCLKAEDLIALIRAHGSPVTLIPIE